MSLGDRLRFYECLLFWALFSPSLALAQTEARPAEAAEPMSETTEESTAEEIGPATRTLHYTAPAIVVDLTLVYGGIGLFVLEEMQLDGVPAATGELGLALVPAGLLLGGVLTHSIYGNPEARVKSVGLRLKHVGLGAAMGAGAGLGAGLVTSGFCGLVGGGFCPLALGYGLVGGAGAGLVGGLVRGMVLDYKTLARKEVPIEAVSLRPTLAISSDGDVKLGVSGRF